MLFRSNQPGVIKYETKILSAAEVREMLPDVGPEVVGGSYCPLDGHVNSQRLLRALHTGLDKLGAAYLPSHRVTAIDKPGGVFRLTTDAGLVSAGKVVLAAGNANMQLAPLVGLNAPMKPERLDDFLRPEWKGRIASTPYAAGYDVLVVTAVVEDSKYLNQPFIVSSQFKKQADAAGWDPTPCSSTSPA